MADCCKSAIEKFREVFGKDENPKVAVFAPGRVNLIGEHTDYNGGFVLPMALPLVTVIVGKLSEAGMCRVVTTATFDDQESIHKFLVPSYPPDEPKLVKTDGPKWARYVQGVIALMNKGGDILPFDAVIASSVPLGGGVSSSAALEVAMCLLVEQLSPPATPLNMSERALLCQQAEHRYAGMPCGIMDQFVSVMAKEGHALLIDCCSQGTEDIPLRDRNLVVLVTNSNYKHDLVDGEYRERRESCESAAAKLGKKFLRDVTMEELEAHKDLLNPSGVEYRRARHVITEIQRTLDAVEALRAADYRKFGRLMHESHCSLRDDYEVSCQELDNLVELALQGEDEAVYGSRMTGGGFGGCTVTLLHRSAVERTKQRIESNYKSRDGKSATFYEATPSKGADVIPPKLLKQLGTSLS